MKRILALIATLALVTGSVWALETQVPAEPVAATEADQPEPVESDVVEEAELSDDVLLVEAEAQCDTGLPTTILFSDCNAPGWCDNPDDFCGCVYSGGRRGQCARAYC